MAENLDLDALERVCATYPEHGEHLGFTVKQARALIARIRELEASAAMGQVPEGWKLVPYVATVEMREAALSVDRRAIDEDGQNASFEGLWLAAMEASPQPPATIADDARPRDEWFSGSNVWGSDLQDWI